MNQLQPVLVSHLFPELLDELIVLLKSLTEEEWEHPTICSPWSVKDVCTHLLGVEIGNLSYKRDQYFGFVEIESFEHLVQLINEQNARWVGSAGYLSTPILIDLLEFAGKQCEYFQSIDPHEIGVPVDWIGPDPAPNWVDIAREYTERWHHQQHIRDAVGKPGLKGTRFLAPILDAFILGVPRTFRESINEKGTTIQISITGSVIKSWVLVYTNSERQLYEGSDNNPSASVSIPDDIAWRLFTKGITPEDAKKHVQLSGNHSLAEKVLDTISIVG